MEKRGRGKANSGGFLRPKKGILPKKSPQKPHFMGQKKGKGCATTFPRKGIEK